MSGTEKEMPVEKRDWLIGSTQLAPGVWPPGFAPVTEEAVDAIVDRVVTELQPVYGTPSEDSDVDLLVIMETDDRPADRYVAVSRLIRPRPFPLDIIVKTPEEIAQALEQGDFFIREIINQGRVLYERPN